MTPKEKIAAIQTVLEVKVDGLWGPITQKALDKILHPELPDLPIGEEAHNVWASSFADPADVNAFRRCKETGGSDRECFKLGDNGMGCWDEPTSEGTGASAALPPEIITAKWGSVSAGKDKPLMVIREGKVVVDHYKVQCLVKDIMPRLRNLRNKATIDLNPDACRALGLEPPIMEKVTWWWL